MNNTTYSLTLSLKDFQKHTSTSDIQFADALLGPMIFFKSDIVSQKKMSIVSIKDNYNNCTDIYSLNIEFDTSKALTQFHEVIENFISHITLSSPINRGQLKGNEIDEKKYSAFMHENIKITGFHNQLEDSLDKKSATNKKVKV